MKKYKVTWGWNPPQYEKRSKGIWLFYNAEEVTREVTHLDIETNEEITETITEWLCDVVVYYSFPTKDFDKWRLTECVKAYDSSKYVNEFTINGIPVWLDKDTRTGLQLRFEAEAAIGKTETTLWYEGQQFTLPLDKAIEMLKAIEAYASKCYNVTQEHLYNINSLEDIKNYDYKSGYPDKLNFELL